MEPYIKFMGTLQNSGFWLVKEDLPALQLLGASFVSAQVEATRAPGVRDSPEAC